LLPNVICMFRTTLFGAQCYMYILQYTVWCPMLYVRSALHCLVPNVICMFSTTLFGAQCYMYILQYTVCCPMLYVCSGLHCLVPNVICTFCSTLFVAQCYINTSALMQSQFKFHLLKITAGNEFQHQRVKNLTQLCVLHSAIKL
jgi:hypothetical protein